MVIMMKEFARRIKNIRVLDPLLRLSLLACVLFLFAPAGKADNVDQKFSPGLYEFLMLAIDPEGEVLGFYRETQGHEVVISCTFFLKGKDMGGQANLVVWGEAFHGPVADKGEIFPGLLQNESEAVTLKIKQIRKEPGCDAVLTPEISDEGFNLRRTAATKWVGLRIVKNTRAPLFSGPSLDKKTRAYFIRNNVLGVVSVSGDWINVEFPRDGKKMIIGWVRSDDVEDLQPPQKKIVSPLPPRRPMRE